MDIELQEEQDKALERPSGEVQISTAAKLAREGNELTSQIIEETDANKLNDLTKLFELNRRKKDIVRANKLSNLLTMIDDEIVNRITATPERIEDRDLVKYMESAQEAINVGEQAGTQITQINITQNSNVNINANDQQLSRESRQKVLSAVQDILKGLDKTDIIDVEAITKGDS